MNNYLIKNLYISEKLVVLSYSQSFFIDNIKIFFADLKN